MIERGHKFALPISGYSAEYLEPSVIFRVLVFLGYTVVKNTIVQFLIAIFGFFLHFPVISVTQHQRLSVAFCEVDDNIPACSKSVPDRAAQIEDFAIFQAEPGLEISNPFVE